ncbi:unnamed protein product [Phyllotreta striolata]|uniref:tRNA (adenine(58)-N(1))-methyltransferase catalytic subunit TRMT61A n=1 Tax=Phyllotreta striolata TaxID=444603 RepID=A0A9N9TJN7_PHYSR|nr:unnamed protein product [Phyllotreta striolata]
MSFDGYKTLIKEGDVVIVYLTPSQIYSVEALPKITNKKGNRVDNVFQTPYGALRCGDLIGARFGTKVQLSKGWAYVLQPTPELWTVTLPHRTQIIYTPDISMIILQLEISPGSVVVESGTGSGSLSHALIRAVKPHGHLHTFEFHEGRAATAQEEFKQHGLSQYVTVRQRDVCERGFGDELNDTADAVFLDLPHPWLAVPHAIRALKSTGGRLCSFSPCIEQVQRTCLALLKAGFQEMQTMEVLQTQWSVQQRNVPVVNLEFVRTEKAAGEAEKKERETAKAVVAVPPASLPGHTGYMTFATLPPLWARTLQMSLNETDIDAEGDAE